MENLPRQFGRYELIAQLGKGGFATVYHARDQHLLREVAIKILHAHLAIEPAIVERFKREAEAAAQLSHPNIITIHDWGVQDGHIYIVMGLVIGHSVDELLKAQDGVLPREQVLSILRQVASALDYAHSRQLVHRDIKPSNVLIDEHGLVTLTDFGLVKALAHQSMTLTGLGEIAGTPAYLAPEQAEPNRSKEVGPAADVYSLGVFAYRLLTGELPFTGNIAAVLYGHIRQAPPDPKQIETTLSGFMSRSLLRALAKKPTDRYQSAGLFIESLTTAPSSLPERWAVLPLYAKLLIPFASAALCVGIGLGTLSYMGEPIPSQIAGIISAPSQTSTIAPTISPTEIVVRVTATDIPIQNTATTVQALTSNATEPTSKATATEKAIATETKTATSTVTTSPTVTKSATATQTETKTATATKKAATPTGTAEALPSPTEVPTEVPTEIIIANTAVPTLFVPTETPFIPTVTFVPPTVTFVPPTETFIPPTETAIPPTETAIPPTETAIPPTETAIPPTATQISYPPPELEGPESGITIARRQPLRWRWNGPPLQENEYFDLRIWREGEAYTSLVWEKSPEHEYDPRLQPPGEYFWTVVVIRGVNGLKEADLSSEPAPLRFISAPRRDDGGGNNPPLQGDNNGENPPPPPPQGDNNGENPPPPPPQGDNNGQNPPPPPPQGDNNGQNPPPPPPQGDNNGENPPSPPPQEGNNNDRGGNDNGGGGNNNDRGGNDNGGGGNNNDRGGNDNGGGGNNNDRGGNDNGGGGNNNDGGGRGQNPPPAQP